MYAAYALHTLHWEPSRFAALPRREKAMVIAMIDRKLEQEKRMAEKRRKRRR